MGIQSQLARVVLERRLIGYRHPYVVDIKDAGQCNTTSFLFVAMELLESRTLGNVHSEIPYENVGVLISQLAQAARHLESLDIVHRDIKPSNVYVSEDLYSVKLLDLGVIRVSSDDQITGAGTQSRFLGTARYSPPEFLYRQEEDTAAGWRAITFYQLGATLYDLVMQRQIFSDRSEPPAVLYEAVSSHEPVIESENHEPWLIGLARRCLIKNWRNRLASVCWEDFEGPRSVGSVSEIKDRITRRYRVGVTPTLYCPKRNLRCPTRRSLEKLSITVATFLRDLCQAGGVFPPISIYRRVEGNDCIITLGCGPSKSHSLLGILQVRMVVTYTDDAASIIRIRSSSRLCATSADESTSWYEEEVRLVVGEVDGAETRDAVDRYVHGALEHALSTRAECGRPILLYPSGCE